MPFVSLLIKDLRGLLLTQFVLLLLTAALTGADAGDVRLQLVFFVFLLPGWLLAPAWTGRRAGVAQQYAHAVIGSVAAHGCLAGLCFLVGVGFTAYFVAFAILLAVGVLWRIRSFRQPVPPRRLDIRWPERLLWVSVMVLIVAVFRAPRSNDILQFSLQQQDMAADRSLQPSSIGMTALGVEEPMARWRAHLWHLWPGLLAAATGLPVDGVLFRWAPIPLAFAVIASLMHFVRSLSGGRTPLWAVALAVFGPVVLWWRSYNAFNYSFRVTNNFCLDKDFCLFFLIPAVVYLVVGYLRGARTYLWPLLCLIPAILKFHPLTAVYLVLLLPFVVIGYQRTDPRTLADLVIPNRQSLFIIASVIALFVAVLLIGDAQSSHQHVNQIITLDFADSRSGRPLHYWGGHYAAVPDHGLSLDTTAWSGGKLHLRARVLLNCGLLAVAQLSLVIWFIQAWRTGPAVSLRRAAAGALVLGMLWCAWLLSPVFLTRFPHYLGGYERLHWFAYTPALVMVATAATIIARWLKAVPSAWWSVATSAVLIYSAAMFVSGQPSVLTRLRGLNSLLDYELPAQQDRWQADTAALWTSLRDARPGYLRPEDRVLFLDTDGNDQYWLIKQGVFWSEPYAEAFALERRGDALLTDRRYFYALLDRLEIGGVHGWLDQRGVTLIVDRRGGAAPYLQSVAMREQLPLTHIADGVWRIERQDSADGGR
jgi:hypothetical protein